MDGHAMRSVSRSSSPSDGRGPDGASPRSSERVRRTFSRFNFVSSRCAGRRPPHRQARPGRFAFILLYLHSFVKWINRNFV